MADQNQVVGSGKLFFDIFSIGSSDGTGELYLGNTPSLSTSSSSTELATYDSIGGIKVKTESYTVGRAAGVAFSLDDISPANLALWFGGSSFTEVRDPESAKSTAITSLRNRYFQIGKSSNNPSGSRNITNVVVMDGITPVLAAGNYTLDKTLGRLFILPDSALVDGTPLVITFDVRSSTKIVTIARNSQVIGALRFVSKNVFGKEKNYFWPKVKLISNGDYALKGDDWQSLSFSADVMKLNDFADLVYIDDDPLVIGQSPNEEMALQYGTPEQILTWVNRLDAIVNVQVPRIVLFIRYPGTPEEVLAWTNIIDAIVNEQLPQTFN